MKSVKFLAAAFALTAITGAFAAYDDGSSDSAWLNQPVAASTQAAAPAAAAAPSNTVIGTPNAQGSSSDVSGAQGTSTRRPVDPALYREPIPMDNNGY
jgi:hypothetical protein